jgi:hypothetical protein
MVHKVSTKQYLKNMISDINVNSESYKREVLQEIHKARLSPAERKRYLSTAVAVKPNSFMWIKQWDRGKIFEK